MHVPQVLFAGDELRVAGVRGDEAVEALAQMADGDGRAAVALQIGRYRSMSAAADRVGRHQAMPAVAGMPLDSADAVSGVTGPQRAGVVERRSRRCAGREGASAAGARAAHEIPRPRLVVVAGRRGHRTDCSCNIVLQIIVARWCRPAPVRPMSRVDRVVGLARSLAIYHLMPRRQRPLRALYAQWSRPATSVFDIGAHVGNRTRAFVGARLPRRRRRTAAGTWPRCCGRWPGACPTSPWSRPRWPTGRAGSSSP